MRSRSFAPVAALVWVLVVPVAAPTAVTQDAPSTPDLKGKLYRSVFASGAGSLTATDAATVAEPLRTRLTTYLARRAAFKSLYKSSPDAFEKVRADAKRRELERSIVALIDSPGIEKAAMEFVAAAPIAYEWEGTHGGPVAEAAYAEKVLTASPSGPLAPWLCVFIAQRQRVAFEAYENEKNQPGMTAAARAYRSFAARGREAQDPIFRALVDDMERVGYLYMKSSEHPRDFAK